MFLTLRSRYTFFAAADTFFAAAVRCCQPSTLKSSQNLLSVLACFCVCVRCVCDLHSPVRRLHSLVCDSVSFCGKKDGPTIGVAATIPRCQHTTAQCTFAPFWGCTLFFYHFASSSVKSPFSSVAKMKTSGGLGFQEERKLQKQKKCHFLETVYMTMYESVRASVCVSVCACDRACV